MTDRTRHRDEHPSKRADPEGDQLAIVQFVQRIAAVAGDTGAAAAIQDAAPLR